MIRDPLALLAERGRSLYGREPISQLDHALQTAQLADQAGASDEMVVAALLHDIGHLLHPDPDEASRTGIDVVHQQIGARFLQVHGFPAGVVEPIRLHVDAKRALARDSSYMEQLSTESAHTLVLQGGPLTDEANEQFRSNPWSAAALRLRRWDDGAKSVGRPVHDVEYYVERVRRIRTVA